MKNKHRSILIAGHYGFHNTGDEAILASMIQDLRAHAHDLDLIVLSGDPERTAKTHKVRSILWTDIQAIIDGMRDCDMVILGGGGLFHDYWGMDPAAILTQHHSGISFFFGIVYLANLLKKRSMIYAVGVGPLFSDPAKKFTRMSFDLADVITVRDKDSKQQLIALGIDAGRITVTADSAFGLRLIKAKEQTSKEVKKVSPVIGVAIRNWDMHVTPEFWEREVARVLDLFVEKFNARIVFIPFQDLPEPQWNDKSVAARIKAQMKRKRVAILSDFQTDVQATRALIGNCDIVLGMRLHSVLFAIQAGVPVVGLVYDPKVKIAVEQAGLAKYSCDLADFSADALYGLISNAYQDRDILHKKMKTRNDALVRSNLKNIKLALNLLDKKNVRIDHAPLDHLETTIISQASLISALQNKEFVLTGQNLGLHSELEKKTSEHARQIRAKDDSISALETDRQNLHNRIEALDFDLEKIHTSRYWKMLSHYWGARDRIATAYQRFRNWLRRLIPEKVRRKVIRVIRKQSELNAKDRTKRESIDEVFRGAPLSLHSPAKYDVICLPILDWEARYQRPQHILSRFAGSGHRCFLVRTDFHEESDSIKFKEIQKNIYELQLPGPNYFNVYRDKINKLVNQKCIKALAELFRNHLLTNAICLVQLPFWTPLALEGKKVFDWKIVYDCMDEHSGFSTNTKEMLSFEKNLIEESNLVIASSQFLFEKCKAISEKVSLIRNGVEFEHFNRIKYMDPISHIKAPVIGFFGAISEWFDAGMVYHAASRNPQWQFVLIGDTFLGDVQILKKLPNVHFLGEKPYQELPNYLNRFDVACIPFLRNKLTIAMNPVKLYEYLSAGKPVVSVELPEVNIYPGYYYPVRTRDEFEKQIMAALDENTSEKERSRIEFAKRNTWDDRFKDFYEGIKPIFNKVSIIIPSYNNIKILHKCLDSIWKKTAYPHYEVIVVDNGSDGAIVDFLKDLSSKEPRLKVIFNKKNLGFAKANNIGIAIAKDSEYIVLLNDDTVVTHGWLGRLIWYLQQPNIKLVGPVTNWTANEARIDVDYKNLNGLDEFARRYCLQHQRQAFELPMLAMYCVAMKKELIDEIGLLDERFGLGMFEDDDFSLRVRKAGGRVICAEDVFIHHWGRATLSRLKQSEYDALFEENRNKFEQKWGIKWQPHQSRVTNKTNPYQRFKAEES